MLINTEEKVDFAVAEEKASREWAEIETWAHEAERDTFYFDDEVNDVSLLQVDNPSMKAMYLDSVTDENYFCSYPNFSMPRRSLRYVIEKEVVNPDLPMNKWGTPHITGEVPIFVKVKVPGGEAVRGWVTVLLKLVLNRICTPQDVERVFGPISNQSWANHVLGRDPKAPW
jgi:hypothetical protein